MGSVGLTGYRQKQCLPNLQSFIIVCLKVVLQNLHTPPAAQQPPGDEQPGAVDNGDMSATNGIPQDDSKLSTLMRETEILSKAVAAIFILLLKWFKVSRKSAHHILYSGHADSVRCSKV